MLQARCALCEPVPVAGKGLRLPLLPGSQELLGLPQPCPEIRGPQSGLLPPLPSCSLPTPAWDGQDLRCRQVGPAGPSQRVDHRVQEEKLYSARQDCPGRAAVHPGGEGATWHHPSQDSLYPRVLSSKPSLGYHPPGHPPVPSAPNVGLKLMTPRSRVARSTD